ncbi:MAG: DUF6448 family protein [Candidatus Marinimicrobia bacterium]|nr:DUF6448 family protein [Candidatus Neomarinimicrobiota bacterium]MCF7829534.1 DUF6448 family protein [Candidatus Neomarinimicrobiota bacterium]MCF7880068.1 DUF6448 family protein [Candidatus Neomarinimicrobiota bacterium]
MILKTSRWSIALLLSLGMLIGLPQIGNAHCDKMDGPVAQAAIEALDTGEFQKIQIWVGADEEQELQSAFEQAAAVRQESNQAKELADQYFVETAVRLHRESEGMPFTGVKPAGIPNPEDIVAGDKALESGDVDAIMKVLQEELRTETEKWFQNAMEAKKNKGQSVEAGREWVDAYVKYIVYVHSLYQKINAGPAHGVGE